MGNNIVNLKYLKTFMEKNNISETRLARLIGVDYTTVYRVFKGDRNPGNKFISGLMKSGLDIDYGKFFLPSPLPGGKGKTKTA